MTSHRRIVVGISGASGAIYAQRLIHLLVEAGMEVHLVVSPMGQRMLHDELGMEGIDLNRLAANRLWCDDTTHEDVEPCASNEKRSVVGRVVHHNYRDVGAVIASGSFLHDGMVIIPCSSNSLASVANGLAQNLLHRAAVVTLKERRRLVLVHREAPLSRMDVNNMRLVDEAGGIICPANPGFYMLPKTIDDLVDFVVARVMDLLGVTHKLNVRWGQDDVFSKVSGSKGPRFQSPDRV